MYCFLTIFALISLKEADNLRLGDGSSGILANTKYGTISGKVFSTPSAKEFYAFLDIPYASPPIGKLRFQKPLPPEPWKEVLNATENTKICWQLRLRSEKVENDPRENEDCLYLNVYVPKDPSENEPLAVMVYIHGGMFSFNDGTFKSYKPYNFVERDIIMVSFNFRQGPLGFLTTNDSVIPGNVGLWDQNIALKWVQQNIEAFGGDPKKVTLMGHSSGAVSVTFHMLSKQSAGLFSGAIAESGAGIHQPKLQSFPKYFAYKLAHAIDPKMGEHNSSAELLAFLLSVSPSIISNITKLYPDPKYDNRILAGVGTEIVWLPVLESSEDENAFLKAPLHDNLKDGNFNQVSVLAGITSEEDAFRVSSWTKENTLTVDKNPELVYDRMTGIKEENKAAFWQELKAVYTKEPFHKNFTGLIKLIKWFSTHPQRALFFQ
ncbi:unnamed protein product [Acanthoscelides obtectus]|uniref:Carboxylic ester hydrolase n=1 Tax=Acanthoscelides obtectus TaxID=200917 RepID=A0A9P0PFT8_ACAOB|nr:unnamed protein product [Acanthoscelides obtectus]CAK1676898.1 Esterase B1 [Acanthoscelides obtectus]